MQCLRHPPWCQLLFCFSPPVTSANTVLFVYQKKLYCDTQDREETVNFWVHGKPIYILIIACYLAILCQQQKGLSIIGYKCGSWAEQVFDTYQIWDTHLYDLLKVYENISQRKMYGMSIKCGYHCAILSQSAFLLIF